MKLFRKAATFVGEDWQALIKYPAIGVVLECTGDPVAAIEHCLFAFDEGEHVVNAAVEAEPYAVWP